MNLVFAGHVAFHARLRARSFGSWVLRLRTQLHSNVGFRREGRPFPYEQVRTANFATL